MIVTRISDTILFQAIEGFVNLPAKVNGMKKVNEHEYELELTDVEGRDELEGKIETIVEITQHKNGALTSKIIPIN
jgi:hypothetical protein